MSPSERRPRRNDPERRDRIIDTCLDVIAEVGVAGASYRKIAAAADIPLGSMTYHFINMDSLLEEAFTRFAEEVAGRFECRMRGATDAESACEAVIAIIRDDVFGDQRDLVLTHELYTLSARNEIFRGITSTWMARSRAALELYFEPEAAHTIDALIEGLTIHGALDVKHRDFDEVDSAVRKVIAALT